MAAQGPASQRPLLAGLMLLMLPAALDGLSPNLGERVRRPRRGARMDEAAAGGQGEGEPRTGATDGPQSQLTRVDEVRVQMLPRKFANDASTSPRNVLAMIVNGMGACRITTFPRDQELPERRHSS